MSGEDQHPNFSSYVRCFRERGGQRLESIPRLAGSSSQALDLLGKMLQLDAEDRISVDEALTHPLFRNLYAPCKVYY